MATNFRGKYVKLTALLHFSRYCRNGIEYRDADKHVRSAMMWRSSFINFVRFRTVTPEFTCLIYLQQASTCTGVSVTAFTR